MGASFTNLALLGPAQKDVADYLKESGKAAFVAPATGGWTLLAESKSESFDFDVVRDLAEELTRRFACPGLSVQFYDDDILLLQVFTSGTFVESYGSNPAYGAEELEEMLEVDRGGDAEKIALAFNKPHAVQALQEALHGNQERADEEFAQLNERLAAAISDGDMDALKLVQLRLMEKTREIAESGEDPFLKYAPGFDARRRYAGLVKALSLPDFCQDFGFRYLDDNEEIAGVNRTNLIRT